MRFSRCTAFLCALCALTTGLPGGLRAALASPTREGNRLEARERFDRGLTLFNQGDNDGALAEFQRAYQLTGNAIVLHNIARVYAAASDPVAALDTVDQLLTRSAELSPTRRAELEVFRAEQLRRVGVIVIGCVPAVVGTRLEVDGADRGAEEPERPLRLAVGRHVVGVLAPGYLPQRKTVLLAGQERQSLDFALEPVQGALGRLHFAVQPDAVAVAIDGPELGRTPTLLETALAPGKHRLELRRSGYRPVTRDLFVPEAGLLDVTESLSFDVTSGEPASRLRLTISEASAVVQVDGRLMSEGRDGWALPEGEHRLRVERAGFFSVERRIVLRREADTPISVTLAPTAAYRADYVASATSRRVWAWGLGLGGAVLAGAGAGYLLWNQAQIDTAQQAFDAAFHMADGACRPAATAQCDPFRDVAEIRAQDLATKRDRQVVGWLGVGFGVAALGTGLALGLTGPDPHRYEPHPASDVFGSWRLNPWATPVGAGAVLSGHL